MPAAASAMFWINPLPLPCPAVVVAVVVVDAALLIACAALSWTPKTRQLVKVEPCP
jgi:hypothetical protein